MLYDLAFMWKLKYATNSYREEMVVARGKGWEMGQMGEDDLKVQTSSYMIIKSKECRVQHSDYS